MNKVKSILLVSAQQNPSIQGKHGCHRFEIYGNYTRDNINRTSEE